MNLYIYIYVYNDVYRYMCRSIFMYTHVPASCVEESMAEMHIGYSMYIFIYTYIICM
jgi:hypothetical protein